MFEQVNFAITLWTSLNVLLMLLLALNVTRNRLNHNKPGFDEVRLNKAIRAHGNNIEYVPIVLFTLFLASGNGLEDLWIHVLGAALFVSRTLHAIGIQQAAPLPPARVLGNIGTWSVMLVSSGILLAQLVLA